VLVFVFAVFVFAVFVFAVFVARAAAAAVFVVVVVAFADRALTWVVPSRAHTISGTKRAVQPSWRTKL
jgi:hypothetical protein